MDFITGLPRSIKKNDSIMVVVDKLSKETHFIPVKSTYKYINIVDISMKEILLLHGIPKTVILDREMKFTGKFWKALFKGLRTQLNFNTTYHTQMDGKIERTNKIVEDMLRMYVMGRPNKLEEYLHLIEITYNNNYQASIKLGPFEILYRRKCNTHVLIPIN